MPGGLNLPNGSEPGATSHLYDATLFAAEAMVCSWPGSTPIPALRSRDAESACGQSARSRHWVPAQLIEQPASGDAQPRITAMRCVRAKAFNPQLASVQSGEVGVSYEAKAVAHRYHLGPLGGR